MKKRITKIIALILSTTILSVFTACGGTKISFNDNKVNIYVQGFDGGYGQDWLDELETRFEEKFKDYSINGKTGVDIHVTLNRDTGVSLLDKMSATTGEIFFTEQVPYYSFVNKNLALDITDIVTDKLTEYGENESIEDKMNDELKNSYAIVKNGQKKYYGLQFSLGYSGLVYDEEMFYNYGLYLSKNYDEGENLIDSLIQRVNKEEKVDGAYSKLVSEGGVNYYKTVKNDYLSAGPDGKYGTMDDGQPDTYDAFFTLCAYMKGEFDINPIICSGRDMNDYLRYLYAQLVADYNGKEQTLLNYTFNGVAKNLISINGDNEIISLGDVQITENNASDVYKSAGHYYAIKFISKLFENRDEYLSSKCFTGSNSHIMAQEDFYYSTKDSTKNCFLIDGVWWQREASLGIKDMAESFGSQYSMENRTFKFLSLPKATKDKVGENTTYVDVHRGVAFIRSDISSEKEYLAKQFVRMAFTDESNKKFTTITGTTRPYNYELSTVEYNSLSYFSKNLYNHLRENTIDFVLPYSQNETFVKNSEFLLPVSFGTVINKTDYVSFKNLFDTNNFSAEQVFKGVFDYANKTIQ